ncbi:uncharacterized protein TM35_000361650, partial [Trypanosoma theileri]
MDSSPHIYALPPPHPFSPVKRTVTKHRLTISSIPITPISPTNITTPTIADMNIMKRADTTASISSNSSDPHHSHSQQQSEQHAAVIVEDHSEVDPVCDRIILRTEAPAGGNVLSGDNFKSLLYTGSSFGSHLNSNSSIDSLYGPMGNIYDDTGEYVRFSLSPRNNNNNNNNNN